MKWIRKLYDWVMSFAEVPWARWALFGLAFAEASFFPVPPDVLLIALGAGKPKKAFRFALICLLGSVSGGFLGYFIGFELWQMLSWVFFTYVPGFTVVRFEQVKGLYHLYAFWAVFLAAFTPIPYKVFTIAAGVAQLPLLGFGLASILGRGTRFFLVSALFYFFGSQVQAWIDRYFNLLTILFALLLVLGFFVLF